MLPLALSAPDLILSVLLFAIPVALLLLLVWRIWSRWQDLEGDEPPR